MSNEASTQQLQKIRRNLLAIRQGATPSEMSERMRDMCNINGYDPVFEIMELIRNGARVAVKDADGNEYIEYVPLDAKEQFAIHKEMMKYIYPQLKAVDIQGHIDANVTVTVKQYSTPFDGKSTAIDASFLMVQEKIEENVAKVLQKSAGSVA